MRTPKDHQVATLELAATLLRREAKLAQGYDQSSMWCPRYMYSGIHYLQRNCDVYCDEPGHDDDVVDCFQPTRRAGTYIAAMSPPVGRSIIIETPATEEGEVEYEDETLKPCERVKVTAFVYNDIEETA